MEYQPWSHSSEITYVNQSATTDIIDPVNRVKQDNAMFEILLLKPES